MSHVKFYAYLANFLSSYRLLCIAPTERPIFSDNSESVISCLITSASSSAVHG
nr:MAG TPA: hypothetical protein [Bacteriophage sp.]